MEERTLHQREQGSSEKLKKARVQGGGGGGKGLVGRWKSVIPPAGRVAGLSLLGNVLENSL